MEASQGTRFRVFVLPRYARSPLSVAEIIEVNVPPGKVLAGPSDARMAVVDALDKRPYGFGSAPPYAGPRWTPARPGPDGHFDHIDPESREFFSATMYASVRRVLDLWERYLGRTIRWYFSLLHDRLELIPLAMWNNAQSGYGFVEFGFAADADGRPNLANPYCENFDILAHEMGHTIVSSVVGVPRTGRETLEYAAFHESAADLVALVAALHFERLVDHVLERSCGDLFSINELSRIGETAKNRQVRVAFNSERLSTVSGEPHALSQPLTGAIFDVLVEMVQARLVAAGLISRSMAQRASHSHDDGGGDPRRLRAEFAGCYRGHGPAFKAALLAARDDFGRLLAETWTRLYPEELSFARVAETLLAADAALFRGAHAQSIDECFAWREISFRHTAPHHRRFAVDACRLVRHRHG